nr:MAG TPA: hypothetical protein [Caudoviricetes sp.]
MGFYDFMCIFGASLLVIMACFYGLILSDQ